MCDLIFQKLLCESLVLFPKFEKNILYQIPALVNTLRVISHLIVRFKGDSVAISTKEEDEIKGKLPMDRVQSRNLSNNGRRRGRRNRPKMKNPEAKVPFDELPRNVYPRLLYFQILCGNYGAEELCQAVFRKLQYSDSRTAEKFNLDQLIYCTLIAHLARCCSVAINRGYKFPEMHELDIIGKSLWLPDMIANYIEAIGAYEMSNGITVVPWVADKEDFYSPQLGQLQPEQVLARAGRPIPNNRWAIDREWIAQHNMCTTHPLLSYRRLDLEETSGSVEMLITPHIEVLSEQPCVIPSTPEFCTDAEAQTGACYNYRRISDISAWPAETAAVCKDFHRGTRIYSTENAFCMLISTEKAGRIKGKLPMDRGQSSRSSNRLEMQLPRNVHPRNTYQILCGNYGAEELCRALFLRWPYGSPKNVTLDQLIYCTLIAHLARCATNRYYSTHVDYELLDRVKNLKLPDVIAEYIETIGEYKMSNGITVVPWVADKEDFYSPQLGQLQPEQVLARAGRPIPKNRWAIDDKWITDWNIATIARTFLFRSIDFDKKSGSVEMLMTPYNESYIGDTFSIPSTPEICTDAEAQTGACYNYRRISDISAWPAETAKVCQDFHRGTGFYLRSFSHSLAMKSQSFPIISDDSSD